MELGLGVWMAVGRVRSERMTKGLWPTSSYYKDLGRFDSGIYLLYLAVL